MPSKRLFPNDKFKNRQLKLVKKKKMNNAKFRDLIDVFLRILIFPSYVLLVVLQKTLVEKPLETFQKVKDYISGSYFRSKKYYKKAKKLAIKDVNSDAEYVQGRAVKNSKKKSLFKRIISKFLLLLEKIFGRIGKAIGKIKDFKSYFIHKLKRLVGQIFVLWFNTEGIVYNLRSLPLIITEKLKVFIKESIEESYDVQDNDDVPRFHRRGTPLSRSDSVNEIEIIKKVTVFPEPLRQIGGTNRFFPQLFEEKRAVSDSFQIESRQAIAEVPTFVSPDLFHHHIHRELQSHEEMVDNYFKTFDAVQDDETSITLTPSPED